MDIYDTVRADEIETGDQIIVDGTPYENVRVQDSEDPDEVLLLAYSEDEGDDVPLSLPWDYIVDLWAV